MKSQSIQRRAVENRRAYKPNKGGFSKTAFVTCL